MSELLHEYCDSRGALVRVDRAAGVLRGIKILGLQSRNGRRYLPDALAQAVALYEGAKVNVNHPKGSPSGPRDYQDRIGVIRRAAWRTDSGLFGDLHFNPKHALAEQLIWDAEHAPENVGFSHNVEARTSKQGNHVLVEEILRVQSVDLVADPATTRGLFEGAPEPCAPPPLPSPAAADFSAEGLAGLSLAQLESVRPDLCRELRAAPLAECERLAAELAPVRAELGRLRRDEAIRRLLAEFALPPLESARSEGTAARGSILSESFLASLRLAADAAEMRRLVEDRAALVGALRAHPNKAAPWPCSRDQYADELALEVKSAAQFVRSICR
ncbi:MAG TPA: hypothetical protein VFE24_18300 [Pirellulales bacterium]|jgi:hypothetical protein|nr:hypothetical protein [Pirellulales bacterium]